MSADFDPYHKWLGIPPKLQPPNHYRLLGVELFESDLDVIDAAASQRMAYLEGLASGEHGELSQVLSEEVVSARDCLLTRRDKEAYDADLKHQIKSSEEKAKRVETRAHPANIEGTEGKDGVRSERPPVDDGPVPPPVAEAPPVTIPEPDAAPPAKPVPPPAPPKKPPPVRAEATSAIVAPVVSVPTERPTSHARQLRKKRGNPTLVAIGSVAAVLVLLAVIYFATGQWDTGRPSESGVSQSASQDSQPPNGQRTAEQPTADASTDDGAIDGAIDGALAGSTGRNERPNDGVLASSPFGNLPAGKPKPMDESPLQEQVPFAAAVLAITNGEIERARPLLDRVLESRDTQQRTWARQMLEELDIAISDYAAQELLDQQLSDEQLELFVEGKMEVGADDRFSYPSLGERFRQTLKKNAPAVLARRRENRKELMAAASDRPSGDAVPRVEAPPSKPQEMEADPPADPAEFLEYRGLRKREDFWLLEGDDNLQESVAQVDGLSRSSRAADTALLKAIDTRREFSDHLAVVERTGRIGIIEEAQRRFNNWKREYREIAAKSMKTRSELIIASLQAARKAEEVMGKYRELADDPNVQRALEQLDAETNRLGPTSALGRNLERVQKDANRLLTDQVMGFFGGDKEDVFHVDVIVNERASALFALRPRAEFSLVPEQVLREAGIPYDAEWKVEQKVDGVEFRTNRVAIPSLRLGRFVSPAIEAFVLPADIRGLNGFLTENAFPNFRIDFKPGESVARLRATR